MQLRSFKKLGPNVQIYEPVTFVTPENIILEGHDVISEYCWIHGGQKTTIGQFCHLATGVCIGGGGECTIEDFANIASGTKVITGSDLIDGSGLMGPTIPKEFRAVERSFVHLRQFSFLATNVIVLPGITIGEGAVASAGSVVTKDLDAWTIYAGVPARIVRRRKIGNIYDFAEKVYKQSGTKPSVFLDQYRE